MVTVRCATLWYSHTVSNLRQFSFNISPCLLIFLNTICISCQLATYRNVNTDWFIQTFGCNQEAMEGRMENKTFFHSRKWESLPACLHMGGLNRSSPHRYKCSILAGCLYHQPPDMRKVEKLPRPQFIKLKIPAKMHGLFWQSFPYSNATRQDDSCNALWKVWGYMQKISTFPQLN